MSLMGANLNPPPRGSRLDADQPENGVLIPRRFTIRGEARLVERAFGLGACALAEAMQIVSERLELEAA